MLETIPILAAAVSGDTSARGSVAGLLLYITVALGFSFLCSILEAILLTSSQSYIEVLAEQGKRAGLLMRRHKQNVEQAISAILTLNTIAHTVGAAGAGAQAAAVFGNEWLGVISAVLTLLILVFSEIIPKTLGAVYWKPLIPFAAYTIRLLVIALYPAVFTFHYLSQLMTSGERSPSITRSELEVLAQIGTGEGALDQEEHLILKNLLQLNKVQVRDIMTPRTVMTMVPQSLTIAEMQQQFPMIPYSRIPVYGEDIDDIQGFVLRYHILSAAAEDRDAMQLKLLTLPIHSIPETVHVAKVLQEFIQRQEHMFLVIDEYGGTAGIITLEDAIESLLGVEITDESDVVADLRTLAKQRFERQLQIRETIEMAKPGTAILPSPASPDSRS